MLREIKIGNVVLKNNIFLAPMAGVTDLPFRLLCKEQGCGLVYTEMVSAKGIFYNNENTKELLSSDSKEHPAAVQLFGRDPEIMADMARKLESTNFEIIDINMGCPVPKLVRNGEGSALMREPELVGKIVKAVSRATKKPLTIKIRKGFDENSVNAVEIAKIAEENGAKAIAVHGRTREQFYSGFADWEIIARVREAVSIPVIGNGDVKSAIDAENMLKQTGCSAVMVGRGVQGNPWIFREIISYLESGIELEKPSVEEKVQTALRHGRELIAIKGEFIAVREMRKQLAWYTKGMHSSSKLRLLMNSCESYRDIEAIMQNLAQANT